MLELKLYQKRALDVFTHWWEAVNDAQAEFNRKRKVLEEAHITMSETETNYPKLAWENLSNQRGVAESAGPYADRTDDTNRPIPHVCFKVPTGGGKTLLAAGAVERLNRQTGLVLWIVPSKAIFAQTKDALWSRQHPYRQILERASAGRVKVLEKDEPLNRADIANYMCVMLLMLPAANRQKGREFLRMFRHSGRYPSFFPESDDILY